MPALGEAIDWTDEQIEELATVTPSDIERAKAFWRKSSRPRYKNLLDAEPAIDEELGIDGLSG